MDDIKIVQAIISVSNKINIFIEIVAEFYCSHSIAIENGENSENVNIFT